MNGMNGMTSIRHWSASLRLKGEGDIVGKSQAWSASFWTVLMVPPTTISNATTLAIMMMTATMMGMMAGIEAKEPKCWQVGYIKRLMNID